ncbi:MAG TPA: fatty acyl-CoA reductase, partial [Steroidobacteraceae bacterium]|nr:fatty acyl-CoA reductase [Steroidobacteraceae bacterium]
MPLVRTRMIAPTKAYQHADTLSPDEAAEFVVDAIIHRSPRVVTRLGLFARFMELFAPKISEVINAASFKMFPDSAAALGSNAKEQPPSKDAMVFANLMKGLHW